MSRMYNVYPNIADLEEIDTKRLKIYIIGIY